MWYIKLKSHLKCGFETINKTMKIIIIIFTLISLNIFSQENDLNTIPTKFFAVFKDKGSDAAIDYIYSTNSYMKPNMPANLKIKAELKKITSMLDDYYGYELIKEQKLGNSYVKQTYMARFKRQPIRFIFVLYKANETWQLQQFKFDDKLSKMFLNKIEE